jgi:hypothetical protein
VELGHLAPGGRRKVEGEWWRLVQRDEFERFKRDDWPELMRRHAEMRRADAERGWPALPSTWSGVSRQRAVLRRDSRKKRRRRYSELDKADAVEMLRRRVSIRKTAEATGLSKDQVAYLRSEMVATGELSD